VNRAVSWDITPVPLGAEVPLSAMHGACFPEGPWDAATLERILALAGGFGYLHGSATVPRIYPGARSRRRSGDSVDGVLPQWRRHGVGRALMDAVIAKTERDGLGSIVLEVATENEPARRLYAAYGFVQVGRRPGYYRQSGGRADGLILRRGIVGEPSST